MKRTLIICVAVVYCTQILSTINMGQVSTADECQRKCGDKQASLVTMSTNNYLCTCD